MVKNLYQYVVDFLEIYANVSFFAKKRVKRITGLIRNKRKGWSLTMITCSCHHSTTTESIGRTTHNESMPNNLWWKDFLATQSRRTSTAQMYPVHHSTLSSSNLSLVTHLVDPIHSKNIPHCIRVQERKANAPSCSRILLLSTAATLHGCKARAAHVVQRTASHASHHSHRLQTSSQEFLYSACKS